jgi:cytochrome d ubiquinol oxidase subunit I
MVISVNAWMNDPIGFRLVHGKAIDVDPLKALLTNSFIWPELVHMYIAGYIVAGFLLAGAYAVVRLRRHPRPPTRYERTALAIPLTIAAPVQLLARAAPPRARSARSTKCSRSHRSSRRSRSAR